MNRILLLAVALGGLLAPGLAAQPLPLDLDDLDAYFGEEPLVEVNLRGSLLRLAAAATREDEPETAAMIEALNAITVRVYPLSSAAGDLGADLSDLGRQFEAQGWSTFVRVRGVDPDEVGQDVWIYVREDGDAFGGLVVMALDPDEDQAAFVLIDGRIEPDQIGRLTSRFGTPDLDLDDVDIDLDSHDDGE